MVYLIRGCNDKLFNFWGVEIFKRSEKPSNTWFLIGIFSIVRIIFSSFYVTFHFIFLCVLIDIMNLIPLVIGIFP